ncbi:MAG: ATP-binding protein [Acidimicrobiaceae bacterium]|nr:ATP-binding protein [Acidimicrobiaceae bacterium]MDE0498496.1 ATP-binding protein [Acidimicrobiaceae bacterium]
MTDAPLVPRFAARRLAEALADSPAVLIHGPRQCGKTTLAQALCAPSHLPGVRSTDIEQADRLRYAYLTLDDSAALSAATADPIGFVADLPPRVVLDEVQRVPELMSAIKVAIDRDRQAGRFVLTGSTNVLSLPRLSDSLAGRMEIVRLHPLSQAELSAGRDAQHDPPAMPVWTAERQGFLDELFGGRFGTTAHQRLGRELADRICAGGFPAALARPEAWRRSRWYGSYVETVTQRDVLDLARIRQLDVMPRLLTAAAAQTAGLFNVSRLSAPFQLSTPAIRDYLALLERLFVIELLPPWHTNRSKRLVKMPKLHIGDTGVACWLLGVSPDALRADRRLLGALAETFVYGELRRQAGWHDADLRFFHYRDRDGAEVDIVIERSAAELVGIEVKAAATVAESDFRGLRKLRNASGDRFVCGAVLYDGEISASFGDRLHAVPIRRLWE